MEINGYQQLFGNQHSSKYLLCSTEERNSGAQLFEGELMMTEFSILGELSL